MGQLDQLVRPPAEGGARHQAAVGRLRGVAVQDVFEKQRLEARFSFDRFKGWVTKPGAPFKRYGSPLNPTFTPPHLGPVAEHQAGLHGVALQVAFERQTLKPVFSLDRL
jgi:hypothetical protein